MTREFPRSKPEPGDRGSLGVSSLVIPWDLAIGPWSFAVTLASLLFVAPLVASNSTNTADTATATVLVVVGAAGEEEFGRDFGRSAALWEKAGRDGGAKFVSIGLGPTNETDDLEQFRKALAAEPAESTADLWLVFLGHGTFDGKEARFNLRGPDLTATDLAEWLKPFHRPLAVIDASSASSPFMAKLAGTNRVIVTATRSGYEQNYARFGNYVSEAIADPQADLDKDGQTSLLEAFLMASRRVAEFYDGEGRLATEHALLDDNGDGLGTPADWFRGIRAVKKARDGASADGLRAHQFHLVLSEQERKLSAETRARRDELELAIARLREAKAQMKEDDYYARLEKLLLDLAHLYQQGPGEAK